MNDEGTTLDNDRFETLIGEFVERIAEYRRFAQSFADRGDWRDGIHYHIDVLRLQEVRFLLIMGKRDEAWEIYSDLDTAVRDVMPLELAVMIGAEPVRRYRSEDGSGQ